VAFYPIPNLNPRLLQACDRRLAFHGAGTSHAPDGFGQGELPFLADFPFEFGMRISTLRFRIVAQDGRLGTVYADAQCESTCGNNGLGKRPRATLKQSWDLARRLLVVSAQVLMSGRGKTPVEF
jgi:hypothetical protein